MKNWFLLFSILFMGFTASAQEFEVDVTINTPMLQTTDPRVFETLETAIQEFMNNRKWTQNEFEQEERIKLSLIITISSELAANTFEAELALQSTRPVFGSTYETPMVKHQDKEVTFSYTEFQPLEFSETSYIDQLSSILAFYAYIVIGMDYDSFSPFGGEPYYQLAQDVINRIPPAVASNLKGWRSVDGNRNRYWLAENLLSPRVRPYRQSIYDYHRQGLDVMHQNAAVARAVMTQAITTLQDVNRSYPNSMILQVFANTKSDEIIEIYSGAPSQEKSEVVTVMGKIDPPRASTYRQKIGR